MKLKDDFIIEVSYDGRDSVMEMKITACRPVTIYELAGALYDYTSNKKSDVSFKIEFCPFESEKKYHFVDHCIWVNETTVLSDIARQIEI